MRLAELYRLIKKANPTWDPRAESALEMAEIARKINGRGDRICPEHLKNPTKTMI